MSGGPFGRGKAPERQCLPLEMWPDLDISLWQTSLAPVDPFAEGGGERASYRPHSNRKIEKGYGRWLTFIAWQGMLDADKHPADRITPDRVKAYVHELKSLGNVKNTILCRLEELCIIATLFAADRDWGFINRLGSKVRAGPDEPNDKRSRMKESGELLDVGLSLMAAAPTHTSKTASAITYRDGLIIALLTLRPLRRGNFVNLTIGVDLIKTPVGWVVAIPGSASKNHDALEFDWPPALLEQLETYLSHYRSLLAACRNRWQAEVGNRLWVSSHGSPLTAMALYDIIRKRTRVAFGKSLNPHLFRNAAATTLAIHDPAHVRLAAPLLGHRDFATTEQYYLQAHSLEAHRNFTDAVAELRDNLSPETQAHP